MGTTENISNHDIPFAEDEREKDGYLFLLAITFGVKRLHEKEHSDASMHEALDMFSEAENILGRSNLDQNLLYVLSMLRESVLRDWHACHRARDEKRKPRIYLIKHPLTGHLKIGFSCQPKNRIADLQIAIPEKIEVIGIIEGTIKDESELHQKFKQYHVHGEWFLDVPEIREAFGPKQLTIE